MSVIWDILSVILMLIALAGTVIPILPGLPLMVVIYVIYGILDHWQSFGVTSAIIFLVITIIAHVFDYFASAVGAKKFGASRAGIIGSFLGIIPGLVMFNLIGMIIGPFIGAVVGELLVGKTMGKAMLAGWGTLVGFLASSLVRFTIGLIYFFYFLIKII